MSEWQLISTAPRDGTLILLWGHSPRVPDEECCVGAWSTRGKQWYSPLADGGLVDITHWMPLPPVPRGTAT